MSNALDGLNANNPTLMPNTNLPVASGNGVISLQSPASNLLANPRVNASEAITLANAPANGDVLSLTFSNNVLPGNSLVVSATAVTSDTVAMAAERLAKAVNLSLVCQAYQMTASSLNGVLTVNQGGPVGNSTTVVFASTGSTTGSYANAGKDTVVVGGTVPADKWTAVVGGSATAADVVTLTFTAVGLPSGHKAVSYTVAMSDTLALVATGLRTAINADSDLSAANITCPSITTSTTLNISSAGPAYMSALVYVQGLNSETVTIVHVARETIVLRFSNAGFAGGHVDVSHLVVNGDTLSVIAAALSSGVNSNATLEEADITSTVSSATLHIAQAGPVYATLSNQTSGSPGETLTISVAAGGLSGGSGPIVPLANFQFNFGNIIARLRQNEPVGLSINQVNALVAAGSLIM